jgi:hypothetical protein
MEIYCIGCGKPMLACACCQEKVCVFVDKAKPHVPGIYCCRSCRVAFAQEDLHGLQSTSCKSFGAND